LMSLALALYVLVAIVEKLRRDDPAM
jgi:hypothetical protein